MYFRIFCSAFGAGSFLFAAGHRSALSHRDYRRDAQLGMPDWRSHNKSLSDADVTDLVAWLSLQREALSTQLNH
jgi:hypothetical protein